MSIEPPADLRAEMLRVAEQLLPARLATTHTGWAADETEVAIEVGPAMPLYIIGLDILAAGRGLDGAKQVGWRSIVSLNSRPVALADATAEDPPRVQSLNYGPYVAGLTEAGLATDRRSAAYSDDDQGLEGSQTFAETRVLFVPALYLTALWIHDDKNPGQDEVIPAAPTPSGIEANQSVRLIDLLDRLVPTARMRLDSGDDGDA